MKYTRRCIIQNCNNTSQNTPRWGDDIIAFHSIPNNLDRQKRILDHLKRNGQLSSSFKKVGDTTTICSIHYDRNDYLNWEKKYLKKDALPNNFPVPPKRPNQLTENQKTQSKYIFYLQSNSTNSS